MTKVCLISVTPDAEKTMGYVARVSNPKNQDNPSVEGLLSYCIKHNHWSVFEQAFRSFTFQEFSQRYADAGMLGDIPVPDLRRQDTKNRQNSIDDIDPIVKAKFDAKIEEHFFQAQHIYTEMLDEGIAKECARMVLPLATPTRTQKEHMDIANLCREHLICQFPIVAKAMGWCAEKGDCNCDDNDEYWNDLQPCLKIL